MNGSTARKLVAEAFGTFILVLVGTGAIVTNDVSGGAVTHVGIALAFGLVVLVMIDAVGDISGAHLNPAVTLGFYLSHRLGGAVALFYVASQCTGAVLASGLVHALFPSHAGLGSTQPTGPYLQSFVVELVITSILMFVILSVSFGPEDQQARAGIAVGSVIAMAALFAGPISGASMNPARSLGPALVSQQLGGLWIYLTAPCLGAVLAVLLCRFLHGPLCCRNTRAGGEAL